jgi:hypothetical protein
MTRILYESPQVERIVAPSLDVLRYAIYEQPWKEWWKSPNAEAALWVILDDDEDLPVSHSIGHITGKYLYRISADHPSLIIKQPDPDDFFLSWHEDKKWLVPYNGESCEEYRSDHCGGSEFRIPVACLVNADAAFAVVSAFLKAIKRSDAVPWFSYYDLPLPDEIYLDYC